MDEMKKEHSQDIFELGAKAAAEKQKLKQKYKSWIKNLKTKHKKLMIKAKANQVKQQIEQDISKETSKHEKEIDDLKSEHATKLKNLKTKQEQLMKDEISLR